MNIINTKSAAKIMTYNPLTQKIKSVLLKRNIIIPIFKYIYVSFKYYYFILL